MSSRRQFIAMLFAAPLALVAVPPKKLTESDFNAIFEKLFLKSKPSEMAFMLACAEDKRERLLERRRIWDGQRADGRSLRDYL